MKTLMARAPLWLAGAFCFAYLLPEVTRYKALILVLMFAVVGVQLYREGLARLKVLSQPVLWALGALALAVVYGCLIAPEPLASFREARSPVFLHALLTAVLLALLLAREAPGAIARVCVGGFVASALVFTGLEGWGYWQQYQQHGAQIPRVWLWNQRELAGALVFLLPFALVAWRWARGAWTRLAAGVVLALLVLGLLGAHARGGWLAAVVVVSVWALAARQWKALVGCGVVAALAVAAVLAFAPGSMLAEKLRQRDDSFRWHGTGTQSAAFALASQRPISGQGFGDAVYAAAYARTAPQYPQWVYRDPIGPHNLLLSVWFGCGLAGAAALLALYAAIVWQTLRARALHPLARDAVLALCLAFVGAVAVRGLFETTYLNFFGPVVGLIAALAWPRRGAA